MTVRKVIFLIACLSLSASIAMAVQLKPSYTTGEERCYGVSVASYAVDAAGKRSDEPIFKASAVYKYTVLSVQPDQSVKMRIEPVGVILNGKPLTTPSQLGESMVIKVNRYGKVIAIDVPPTKYTSAQTIDLQPYMSEEWRKSSWIPSRDLQQGDTWTFAKQDPRLKKSKGEVSVTLAAENEDVQGIPCCRFDVTGISDVMLDEVMAITLANPPKGIPQSALDKCRPYVEGMTGKGTVSSNTQCWVSLSDGGIVAASGTSRSSFRLDTGVKLQSKRYAYTLENEARLERLSQDEVEQFMTALTWEKERLAQEAYRLVPCTTVNVKPLMEKLLPMLDNQGYMSIVVGASVFDLLLIEGPLDFIDLSFKLHGRLLPDGTDFTNLTLSAGFKVGIDLPVIDFFSLFLGAGTSWGDLAESIKPGKESPHISTALLFGGMSFTPSSAEIGLTTSIVKLSLGCSLSLEVIDTKDK